MISAKDTVQIIQNIQPIPDTEILDDIQNCCWKTMMYPYLLHQQQL